MSISLLVFSFYLYFHIHYFLSLSLFFRIKNRCRDLFPHSIIISFYLYLLGSRTVAEIRSISFSSVLVRNPRSRSISLSLKLSPGFLAQSVFLFIYYFLFLLLFFRIKNRNRITIRFLSISIARCNILSFNLYFLNQESSQK